MKKLMVAGAVLVVALVLVSCGGGGLPAKTSLDTDMERVSYAFGIDVAGSLTRSGAEIDIPSFVQGFRDTLEGGTVLLTQPEVRTTLSEYSEQMREKQMKEREDQVTVNLAAAEVFMEENKTAEGVTTTESGLQYIVVEQGSGPRPTAKSTVKVHYTGMLLDGTKFDSSLDRGEPAEFPVGGVIPGWTEGLQLMSTGSTYKFFIPPDLAYGERGAPPRIEPNSALIFDVELIEVMD